MTSIAKAGEALEEVLGPGSVATHRYNHTGPEKLSFEVHASGQRLWVKVAADDEDSALRTWASVSTPLANRHGDPPVLDVLEIAGRTALLFPFLDAEVANRATMRARYATLLPPCCTQFLTAAKETMVGIDANQCSCSVHSSNGRTSSGGVGGSSIVAISSPASLIALT